MSKRLIIAICGGMIAAVFVAGKLLTGPETPPATALKQDEQARPMPSPPAQAPVTLQFAEALAHDPRLRVFANEAENTPRPDAPVQALEEVRRVLEVGRTLASEDSGELAAARAESALRDLWDSTTEETHHDLRARGLDLLREELERSHLDSVSNGHAWLLVYLRFETDVARAEQMVQRYAPSR